MFKSNNQKYSVTIINWSWKKMEIIKCVLIILLNCLFINYSNCDNILVLFPTPSKSHSILGVALANGLAKKGHNVTFVSPFKQEKKVTAYNDLGLTGIKELFKSKH